MLKNTWLNSTGKVAQREFERIKNRKAIYLLTVFIPIVVLLILFLIFMNGSVHKIPIAIFDEDHSELSTLLIRYIQSAPSMNIVTYANSLEEVKDDFKRGKVDGAFHFPNGMEATVKNNKQANIEVFINTMNLLKSNSLLNDGTNIIKTVSGGILLKKLGSAGLMKQQAMDIINPIKIESKILFNPSYNYEVYLVPALAAFILHVVVLLVSVLLLSVEYSEKTLPELFKTADGKISAVIVGKAVPHIILQSLNAIILIGIFFPLFRIEIAGSVVTAILFTIFFLIVVFFFGLMISSLFHDEMFSTEIALFLSTPAFIFSGLSYPLWIMPHINAAYAQIMPYTYFIEGFVKIYQMGAPIKYLLPEVLKLSLFILISICVIVLGLKYHVKKFYLNEANLNNGEVKR
jgi:ABC-2 type transport system permease protein